ncbi:MAG: hypothetical protein H6741_33880 [Alphaproteobacteria bacterium]|nr:hypothetical protein [Alphaproteobacteria bacterium]
MLLTLWILLAPPASAQSPDGAELVAEMAHAQDTGRTFEVAFEHTMTKDGQAALTHDGYAWFSKGRFRIRYEDIQYYDNDRFVFVHHVDVKRVFVHDSDPSKYWDIDRLFLTDWSKAEVLEVSPEMDAWRVTLKPSGGDVFKADLWIGRDDNQLQRAILFTADGARHAYVIQEMKRARRMGARTFTFSPRKYPDVEILPMTDNYYPEEEEETW